MSSFTKPIKIKAIRKQRKGWRNFMPPGLFWPQWEVAERFEYAVGGLTNPRRIIAVPEGFRFDGASIPLLLRPFFPVAHSDYLQAACVHDWLYQEGGDRRFADDVFYEALGVLGMAIHWRFLAWLAVRIGGAFWFQVKKRNVE